MITREQIEVRRDTVRRLTAEGWSAQQIANKLGITARNVIRYRKALGISRPVAAPYPREVWERAEQMLDDGAPYAEVARTLGVSQHQVANRFPGRGWTLEQRSEWASFLRKQEHLERRKANV